MKTLKKASKHEIIWVQREIGNTMKDIFVNTLGEMDYK